MFRALLGTSLVRVTQWCWDRWLFKRCSYAAPTLHESYDSEPLQNWRLLSEFLISSWTQRVAWSQYHALHSKHRCDQSHDILVIVCIECSFNCDVKVRDTQEKGSYWSYTAAPVSVCKAILQHRPLTSVSLKVQSRQVTHRQARIAFTAKCKPQNQEKLEK